MDILKIVRQAEFDFPTESVGETRCGLLTTTVLNELRKIIEAGNIDGQVVTRSAFQLIARKKEALQEGGDATDCDGGRLTDSEIAALTTDELESFAEKIIKRNFHYLAKSQEIGDIDRNSDETNVDFFIRLLKHSAEAERAKWKKLMEPVDSVLFGSATRDAWAKSVSAVDQFQSSVDYLSTLDKYRSLPAGMDVAEQLRNANPNLAALEKIANPLNLLKGSLSESFRSFDEQEIPSHIHDNRFLENPTHKTNEKLDDLIEQFGEFRSALLNGAKAMGFLEATVRGMQADYLKNSDKADKRTKVAERIAVASFFISAVGLCFSTYFSYKTLIDADEGGRKNEAALVAIHSELQETRAAQKEEREEFIKAIRESLQTTQKTNELKPPMGR